MAEPVAQKNRKESRSRADAGHDNGKRGRLASSVWGGPLVWVAIAALLLLFGAPARQALAFVRVEIAGGQWWRLLSCNFVHLGFWHLFLDAMGLLLWVILCGTRVGWRGWCLRTLTLALGVGFGLYWFDPGLAGYVGLSGMIYGLLIWDLGRDAMVEADGFAALCALLVVVRVVWAFHTGTPAWERQLMGGQVISAAHVCGMVTAALCVGVGLLFQWLRRLTGTAEFRIFGRNL